MIIKKLSPLRIFNLWTIQRLRKKSYSSLKSTTSSYQMFHKKLESYEESYGDHLIPPPLVNRLSDLKLVVKSLKIILNEFQSDRQINNLFDVLEEVKNAAEIDERRDGKNKKYEDS